MMRVFQLVALLLVVATQCLSQPTLVDEFVVDSAQVKVYFIDPLPVFLTQHPNCLDLPPKEQSGLWYEHLHKSAVYLFSVSPARGDSMFYLVLRGDPSVTKSAQFYQVQIVMGNGLRLKDPNLDDYGANVTKSISFHQARGGFFEHSFPPEERKLRAGKGGQMFGVFMYVNAYEKVREGIIPIIASCLIARE